MVLVVVDVVLLVLTLYLLQEGRAQHANPDIRYFVEFPTALVPLAYAALGMLIANFAILAITAWRRLPKRRWPYITTLLAIALLVPIVAALGFDGVRTIIDPAAK